MKALSIYSLEKLEDRSPAYALVAGVDLVVVRYDDDISVLYGRCAHRGALMSDGHIDGENIICGLHGWDYRLDTGVSEYNNAEVLPKFKAWVEDGEVYAPRMITTEDADGNTIAEFTHADTSLTVANSGANSRALIVGKIEWGATNTAPAMVAMPPVIRHRTSERVSFSR